MPKFIALLRGINVSGHHMIRMNDLINLFKDMHFTDIKTYLQSGNVIFQSSQTDKFSLKHTIEEAIQSQMNHTIPVIIRSVSQLKDSVAHNPFTDDSQIDITKLHVTFLAFEPDPGGIEKIKTVNSGQDQFILKGCELFLYCPDGYGNTKINNAFFENKLKVTATTRNWKTVNELVRLST